MSNSERKNFWGRLIKPPTPVVIAKGLEGVKFLFGIEETVNTPKDHKSKNKPRLNRIQRLKRRAVFGNSRNRKDLMKYMSDHEKNNYIKTFQNSAGW